LWSNIATAVNNGVEYCVDFLLKLLVCLQDPVARNALKSINFDACNDRYTDWHTCPGDYEGTQLFPDYRAYLAVMDRLGAALAGTGLTEVRFLALDLGPSDALLKSVGERCSQLEFVELSYDWNAVPARQEVDEVITNGPDPLHWLHRISSASIGMSIDHCSDTMRQVGDEAAPWDLEDEDKIPTLVKWLRGELPDELGDVEGQDNALVNIKTAAPWLYRHRCLVPAWARFNRILELDAELHGVKDGQQRKLISSKFPSGVLTDEAYAEEDLLFIYAAYALRPRLNELAKRNGDDDASVTAEQVVEMMHSDAVFEPWRKWFPGQKVTAASTSDQAFAQSLDFADEILLHWRKSAASRRQDPGLPSRWHTGWAEDVVV